MEKGASFALCAHIYRIRALDFVIMTVFGVELRTLFLFRYTMWPCPINNCTAEDRMGKRRIPYFIGATRDKSALTLRMITTKFFILTQLSFPIIVGALVSGPIVKTVAKYCWSRSGSETIRVTVGLDGMK